MASTANIVLVTTADGRKLLSSATAAFRRMTASKAGTTAQAKGTAHRFTSSSARTAALKRWARHPDTGRGYRRGQRFVRRPPVPRQPLRDRYALQPSRGIQYSPAMRAWFISDHNGTRAISERRALQKLGHLPRDNDRIVPVTIEKRVK